MIKTQMEMYLHEELETLTRTEIEALQFERLLRTVRRCMKSPFYQKRFAEAHLSPEDIRSLDDLRKIPFTTKQDLRDNYPFGLAAVPMSEVVRLHSSSGTTGTPTGHPAHAEGFGRVGQCRGALLVHGRPEGGAMSFRTRRGTVCLRADWASNTEPNASVC